MCVRACVYSRSPGTNGGETSDGPGPAYRRRWCCELWGEFTLMLAGTDHKIGDCYECFVRHHAKPVTKGVMAEIKWVGIVESPRFFFSGAWLVGGNLLFLIHVGSITFFF